MTDNDNVGREECLEAIRRVADELGHPPTQEEYRGSETAPRLGVVRDVLDVGFPEARKMAGVGHPQETDGRKVRLNVDYFAEIDDAETAYWLGTLFGQSSQKGGGAPTITVSHTLDDAHFVYGLYDAIDAGYQVQEYDYADQEPRAQFSIGNRDFIEHLHDVGLDRSARKVESIPDLPEDLRPHFLRGFLEVRGSLAEGGLRFRSNHREKMETLAEWAEALGADHATVSELQDGRYAFGIGSVFDVAPVFERCWIELADPSIRSAAVTEEWSRLLCEEHPYPENLSFCNTDGAEEQSGVESRPEAEQTEDLDRVEESPEEGTNTEAGSEEVSTAETISVSPTLLAVVVDDVFQDDPSEKPTAAVKRATSDLVREIAGGTYPDGDIIDPEAAATDPIEIEIDLPRPVAVAVVAFVEDPQSPWVTTAQFVHSALEASTNDAEGTLSLTVDGETAALLRAVGEGDPSTGARRVVEREVVDALDGQ